MDLSLDYHFRNRFTKEHERGVYRILVNEQYAVCSWAVHKSNSKVLIRGGVRMQNMVRAERDE